MHNWSFVRPSFLYLLNSYPEGKILGVEIGTDEGENAAKMLKHCSRIKLILVDIVDKPRMHKAIEPYAERVNFIHKASVEAAKQFPDKFFDYIYIDGAHDYDNVINDLTAWYPKIKTGGIFSGHDWWYSDVRRAVWDFFKDKPPQRIYTVQEQYIGIFPPSDAEMMDWWFKESNGKITADNPS